MRRQISMNENWYFQRQDCGAALTLDYGEAVSLPHTWNARTDRTEAMTITAVRAGTQKNLQALL
ncbi:MAG: hypothetical protein ACLVEX_07205 [Ruthenibacterium lactatiformans]